MADIEEKEVENKEEASDEEMTRYWDEAVAARGESGSDERPDSPVSESKDEAPVSEPVPEPEITPEVEPQETEESEEDSEKEEKTEEEPKDEPDDPWAGVPDKLKYEFEELKKQRDKYEHSARSNSGRLGAMQKKIDDLSRKLEEKSSGQDGEAESPEKDAGDTLFASEKWKKFKEDYGEVADPIEDLVRASYRDLHSRWSETQKVSQSLQQRQQEEYYTQQALRLKEKRPDWFNFVKDNSLELEEFVNSRSKLKAIWNENLQEITNADEVDDLLTLFEIHANKSNGSVQVASEEKKPASRNASSEAAREAKPNNEPRKLSPKRQQQLKSAASPAPRSHPAPGSRSDGLPAPDDNPEILWNWAVNLPR